MPASPRRRHRRLIRRLAIAPLLCGAVALTAGCGAQSPSHSATRAQSTAAVAGAPTPTASNADVGAKSAQHRPGTRHAGPADSRSGRSSSSSDVTSTHARDAGHASDAIRGGHRPQRGHDTPATSDDDVSRPAAGPNPCHLVTLAQARSITAGAVVSQIEAPLGPTCVYRPRDPSAHEITVAVESQPFESLSRTIRRPQRTTIGGNRAVCGRLGQEMLFVALGQGRVLNVTASCSVARQFATAALARLTA